MVSVYLLGLPFPSYATIIPFFLLYNIHRLLSPWGLSFSHIDQKHFLPNIVYQCLYAIQIFTQISPPARGLCYPGLKKPPNYCLLPHFNSLHVTYSCLIFFLVYLSLFSVSSICLYVPRVFRP